MDPPKISKSAPGRPGRTLESTSTPSSLKKRGNGVQPKATIVSETAMGDNSQTAAESLNANHQIEQEPIQQARSWLPASDDNAPSVPLRRSQQDSIPQLTSDRPTRSFGMVTRSKKRLNYNDDYEDEDFIYEESDTNDDELLPDGSVNDIDDDELAYLVQDQALDIDNDSHQLPMLYYPTLKNRLYAFMRSTTIGHVYKISGYALFLLLVLLLVNQLGQHQSNVRKNGYCTTINGHPRYDSTRTSSRSCIPCPPHGECIGGELFCHPLYRPHRSLLNKMVNFVWPTPQTCTKDPALLQRSMKMKSKILHYLARHQGDQQCNNYQLGLLLRNSKRSQPVSFPIAKIKASVIMHDLKHTADLPHVSNQDQQVELDHLLEQALNLAMESPHVVTWRSGDDLTLGIDYAKYSFGCWCWITLCEMPIMFTVGVSLALPCFLYYAHWAKKRRQVHLITEKALDILKEQRRAHLGGGESQKPGCSVNYLRLHVLPDTDAASIDIWKKVIYNLQHNPCLRTGHTDENGEISQYFEWQ